MRRPSSTTALVFGYGSLAQRDGTPRVLHGHRRAWGVAMDNRLTIPGYKFYVDATSGERPAVYVAYLAIEPDPGAQVNGVAFPAPDVAYLDRRERSYERHDVSDHVDLGGRPIYAYVGRAEARDRLARGRAHGTAVVAREYLERVRAGFAAYGALDDFEATTEPLDLPVADLRRIEVPTRPSRTRPTTRRPPGTSTR